jgi:hypothetical protein
LSQQPHPYQRQSSSRNNSRKNSFNTKKQHQQIIRSNSNNVSANATHPPATNASSKFAARQQVGVPTDFKRQTSLNLKAPTPVHRFKGNENRPHTADHHDGMQNPFEWPAALTRDHKKFDKCDPLASDMEVMVSDMENVLNDDR